MNPKFHKTASSNHIYYITTDFKNVILLLERGTRVVIYHYTFFNTKHDVIFWMVKKLIAQDFHSLLNLLNCVSAHTPNLIMASQNGITLHNFPPQGFISLSLFFPFPIYFVINSYFLYRFKYTVQEIQLITPHRKHKERRQCHHFQY